ncbi:hypothetical protein [Paenibacillus sp. GCM10027626]|uniref:hypothetical protein n=1 Tax=Paenibacillus sp. GCM10027626 TaxID=3273411 RepID=UPI003645DC76
MSYGEFTKNRQGLLLLTGAVVQLILTSTAFHQDQRFKREMDLLTYHSTQQLILLDQLYEVVQQRIYASLAYGQLAPPASEKKEMEMLEAWISKLLTEFLNLIDTEKLPKPSYVLSLERLRDKLIPDSVNPCENTSTVPTAKSASDVYVKTGRMTKSVVNPILHWTKNKSKTTQVTPEKKANKAGNPFKIQIGTQVYKGSF